MPNLQIILECSKEEFAHEDLNSLYEEALNLQNKLTFTDNLALVFFNDRVGLKDLSNKAKPIFVDFLEGKLAHRRKFGGGRKSEAVARACFGDFKEPIIFDGTAGLGRDSFVLAYLGAKVHIGYYDQEHQVLHTDKTIFQEISDAYPRMNNTEIRSAAASFQFKGEDVFKEISVLSGGERGRVVLCKLLLKQANFLILDEPTNHLDIQSKEILEDALDGFEGTILFISHDRYFINKIANKILDFNQNNSQIIDGNYDDYTNRKYQEAIVEQPKVVSSSREDMMKKRRLESDIKKVEQEIQQLETKLADLQAELTTDEVMEDYQRYNDLTNEISTLEQQLETTMEKWEELSLQL